MQSSPHPAFSPGGSGEGRGGLLILKPNPVFHIHFLVFGHGYFETNQMATEFSPFSPPPERGRVSPAPHRVQDNALNLTWFRGWG